MKKKGGSVGGGKGRYWEINNLSHLSESYP
jgi:hypothetical protein